jgi:hypothetical protein
MYFWMGKTTTANQFQAIVHLNGTSYTSTFNITDTNWHHIWMTNEYAAGSGIVKIYVDGAQIVNSTHTIDAISLALSNTCAIGSAGGSSYWDGWIYAAGVYNLAFTPTECNDWLYNHNREPVVTGIADRTDAEGSSINISVSASGESGETLTYSAVGLPAGLSINSGTGAITGTISNTAAGRWRPTVTVTDNKTPVNRASVLNWDWVVSDVSSAPAIDRIALVNADTGAEVAGYTDLADGTFINMTALGLTNVSIKVITNPTTVGSVKFGVVNGVVNNANYRIENTAPYAIAGDTSGGTVYNPWTDYQQNVANTLTVTPYTASNGTGTAGSAVTITFTLSTQSTITPNSTTVTVPAQRVTVTAASAVISPGTSNVTVPAQNVTITAIPAVINPDPANVSAAVNGVAIDVSSQFVTAGSVVANTSIQDVTVTAASAIINPNPALVTTSVQGVTIAAALANLTLGSAFITALTNGITIAPVDVVIDNPFAYDLGSYRLYVGWTSAANVTPDFEISRFPKQVDQIWHRWPAVPLDENRLLDLHAEDVISFGGAAVKQGQGNELWPLSGLTTAMANYLDQVVFGGKNWGQFTIMTRSRVFGWKVYQVYGYLKRLADSAQPGWKRGLTRLNIEFVIEAEAPAGADVSIAISHFGSVIINTNKAFTIVVQNQGDFVTTGDVIVDVALPTNIEIVSVTGTAWTVEYFEDGVWSDAITNAPDVTAVRATRDTGINTSASANNLIMTVVARSEGSYVLTASVSHPNDTDLSNNTASDPFTVTS